MTLVTIEIKSILLPYIDIKKTIYPNLGRIFRQIFFYGIG